MNYREEIGSELQTLRVQKGMSQRELAEASGVHYSNIAKIENGRYNVSVDILGKVADALGYKLTFEERPKMREESQITKATRRLRDGNLTLGELRTIFDGRPRVCVMRDKGGCLTNVYNDSNIVRSIQLIGVGTEYEETRVIVM